MHIEADILHVTTTPAAEPVDPAHQVALTIIKGSGLAAAVLLFAAVGVRLVGVLLVPAAMPFVAAGLLLGYLAADFLSGTAHWFCDTFFGENTPLIGRTVIRPFRDHHRHPAAITRYHFLEQDGSNYFIIIPPLWVAWRHGGPDPASALAVLGHTALWGFALGALGTNLFHKWAHAERVPFPVRWLQRHRLILSPRAHGVHHRAYTGGYCVTSGWMNEVLDPLDFFGRVERMVRLLLRRPRPVTPDE